MNIANPCSLMKLMIYKSWHSIFQIMSTEFFRGFLVLNILCNILYFCLLKPLSNIETASHLKASQHPCVQDYADFASIVNDMTHNAKQLKSSLPFADVMEELITKADLKEG
jgi:hypothetical protein